MSEEKREGEEVDVEFLKASGGGSVMIMMLNADGSYNLVSVLGEPSEEQVLFVEDLLILERASFVLRIVMFIERMWLRLERRIWG
jgi:hypothetical protein